MNCRSSLALATVVACLGAIAAKAGPEPMSNTENLSSSEESSTPFKLSGEFLAEETFVGSADVANGPVKIRNFDENDTIFRFVLTPRTKIGILRIGAEWERFAFDLPDMASLPNILQEVSLVVGLDTQISDSILLRVEVQPGVYAADLDDLRDAFNMPFIAGGTYIYNPNLQFIAGVSVDIEREYPVIPAAGVRWKFSRDWVANIVMPTPRIEFDAWQNFTLYAGANIKQTNFRVNDDFGTKHGNPRLDHAVLSYGEIRTGVGVEWKVSNILTLVGEIGYQPYRDFNFYRAGVEFEDDGSSAPYGMVALRGAF